MLDLTLSMDFLKWSNSSDALSLTCPNRSSMLSICRQVDRHRVHDWRIGPFHIKPMEFFKNRLMASVVRQTCFIF